MMWFNRKIGICIGLLWAAGCSSGFLGLSPAGDRHEYVSARTAYEAGEYQAAVTQLTAYIYKTKNIARREARAYRLLGRSYEQLGDSVRALEVYLEALEFHPDNVPLLIEAGRLYQENGLTERSMELYARALEKEPHNADALAGQALNYTHRGFYSKARSLYDQFFVLRPQAAPVYRARYADTFLRQRNYAQAFIHISVALGQESSNADFWRISAEARYGLIQLREALEDLETAIRLAPERKDLLAQKALWLYKAGEYKKSLQTTREILRQEPENSLARLVQALNWQRQGKVKAARKQWADIAQTDPRSFVGQVAGKLAERK